MPTQTPTNTNSPRDITTYYTLETQGQENQAARQLQRSKGKQRARETAGTTTKAGGKAIKNTGRAVETGGKVVKDTGKAVKYTGKAVKYTGKGIKAGGKGIQAAGKGMTSAGGALTDTVIGAPIGIPLAIVGGGTQAAGVGVSAAGTGVEAAGKVTEAAGKAAEKAGKKIEKGGKKIKEKGKKMGDVGQRMKQAPKAGERKLTRQLNRGRQAAQKTAKGDVGGAKEDVKESIGIQITSGILRQAWAITVGLSFTLVGIIIAIFGLAYINFHFVMKYLVGSKAFCEMGTEFTPGGRMPGKKAPAGGEKIQKEAGRAAKWAEIIALFGLDVFVAFIILSILFIITFPIFTVVAILQ
ncbi:MAG: hypothetical protein A2Y82_02760 [Candidatus Buchananbacteria bacterium RBG_13_36_9]|uniref:Uncharacterized protein n=1 Tax=Candidatus Buchananbacteria bacterium RBG_13_36_9 TaxID=1797530 RepID=A0A1G1XP93_9BACT|nr:MAG: hypothetical protein A2Y82_02760 [Candidatus Buchananbacteria bacterium RBG_13_36_9]